MKKIKDHVRCEVLISKGRYTLVNYVEVDRAYSSEIKGKRFIADRMYDVIWFEEYLRERGIEVVIKRKKNSKRDEIDEEKYVERNAIEALFVNMKRKLDGVVYAFRSDIARILVLVRFLIYNLLVALFLSCFYGMFYRSFISDQ